MPSPSTIPELLDRLRRSGIVPADRLEAFLAAVQTSPPAPQTPAELLERLVAGGLITQFHANKLAQGKYKGFILGSYLVLDQIGSGGMGHVYLAEHINMQRLVALKVFPPQLFDTDPVARERFFREARVTARLDHPNIVRMFDMSQEGKLLYLVMEYVEGISIQAMVARHGPLPLPAACHYARQVAFGLQHAHEMGLVHRDIKPANLLVDRAGVVKILDLGLVRSEAEAGSGLTRQLDSKTVLGTADYVAPEQVVDSSSVDVRADVYSLGATLYFALTGRTLFPEGRVTQKLVWQQIREPTPVDRLRPAVPPELAAVVHRMLAKKREDRYQTSAEVFDALAPFVPDEAVPPDPAWLPRRGSRVAMPGVSGSTSQILAAAMRGGPGSLSGSSVRRPGLPPSTDTGRLPAAPPAGAGASPTTPTTLDETQRPAPSDLPPVPRRASNALLYSLAAALVAAIAVIAYLLLK
ncbi:MAG TPA: serine/threonine-protein kinase [Gemmata sp.]|nr:serine/threonine-protein kinase [Gemmata sp.]